MKKTSTLFAAALLLHIFCSAQQDPEAKKILDRVAEKSKQYTTIQAEFELTIENKREDMSTSNKGILKVKGDKYYMESADTKVYYDGKTLWTYMQDINEVTITEPDKDSEDFTENPTLIFDMYNKDFKYRLAGEVRMDAGWMYEIDLFPKNLDQAYSRFKVFIKKETEELCIIEAVGKDGVNYRARLDNAKYDQALSDTLFVFDPKAHKGIEVVDLRF